MRVVVLLALLIVACYRETPDVSRTGPSQSSTGGGAPQESPPQPATDVTPPGTPSRLAREVHLIEYAVHLPATLPAGRVAFTIENGGKETHALEIEGMGIHEKTAELPRGNTASLDVDLRPGTYTVWCPVKDHAKKGMRTVVTVE